MYNPYALVVQINREINEKGKKRKKREKKRREK